MVLAINSIQSNESESSSLTTALRQVTKAFQLDLAALIAMVNLSSRSPMEHMRSRSLPQLAIVVCSLSSPLGNISGPGRKSSSAGSDNKSVLELNVYIGLLQGSIQRSTVKVPLEALRCPVCGCRLKPDRVAGAVLDGQGQFQLGFKQLDEGIFDHVFQFNVFIIRNRVDLIILLSSSPLDGSSPKSIVLRVERLISSAVALTIPKALYTASVLKSRPSPRSGGVML
ncbi:hypothetical protein F4859DRAFT_495653, partial [Xylaria cf. heliscus]